MYKYLNRRHRNDSASRRHGGRRRGTAMLEFVFVAPILMILIAFVVDLGMAIYTKNAVSDALQASVRVASQRGGAVLNGVPVARDRFYEAVDAAPGLDRSNIIGTPQFGPATCTNTNSTITASAQYRYTFITPGLNSLFAFINSPGVGSGLVLRGSSALRCEIAWS